MEIVDVEQQTLRARKAPERMRYSVKEEQSLLVCRQCRALRKRTKMALDLRREPRKLRREFSADVAQRFRILLTANPASERVDKGEIRCRCLVFVACAREYDRALQGGVHDHLAAHPRFPGAGFATEQHCMTATGLCPAPEFLCLFELLH